MEVFTVDFCCSNCGAEWDETYGERVRVTDQEGRDVIVNDLDCDANFGDDCECCGRVGCPVCKLISGVGVADRNPVES